MLEPESKKIVRVLICDDDHVDRKLVKSYLQRDEHYNYLVTEAGEEDEILQALENVEIDLILLDIQMPGRTGLEWLKDLSVRKVAPVVVLTGYGSETIAVDAMKAGAYDYLPKSQLSTYALTRAITNALEKWRLEKELEEYRDKLERLARTDDLTGLMNRRCLFEQLELEAERAARYRRPLSVILLDLDNFKEVNDKHGHVVGDMVLREAAKIINENIRNVDKAGRYGGDEFILLLPETPLDGAKEIGERIRGALQYAVLYDGDGCIVRLTTSLGIATLPANSNHIFNPSDWLIKKADEALYRAKRMGGNLSSVEETFS